MTPKERVLKKYPEAEFVRDGWDERAGPSGCYDYAVYVGGLPLAFSDSPKAVWAAAARLMSKIEL